MSYHDDLDKAVRLLDCLSELTDIVNDYHEQYPLLTAALFHFICGYVYHAELECPHCKKSFEITTQEPIGGIDTICDELVDCVKILQLEEVYCEPEEERA